MDGKKIKAENFEGLFLWNVKTTHADETLQFLTPTDDPNLALQKAKRWLRANGYVKSRINEVKSSGTIDG